MAAPIVSWYDAENTAQQTTWDTGVVDAGSVGPDTQFLIWNNRGGGTAVSDMESCANRSFLPEISGETDT